MSRSFRALASCALLGLGAFSGCSAGELRLLDDQRGQAGASSGGATASGGAAASGGAGVFGGGSYGFPEGGSCGDPACPSGPCGEAGRAGWVPGCPPVPCDPDDRDCRVCSASYECPDSRPLCSPATSHCVECIRREDCFSLFGGSKTVCWEGRCSSCQYDSDCPFGLECDDGVCGRCDGDKDCPDGLECKSKRCAPR